LFLPHISNYLPFYAIPTIWTGTQEEFETFMVKINKLHSTMKFTFRYDMNTRSKTFLNTNIKITNNSIDTDICIENKQTEFNIYYQALAILIISLGMYLTQNTGKQ
jgi:hypothetical protein